MYAGVVKRTRPGVCVLNWQPNDQWNDVLATYRMQVVYRKRKSGMARHSTHFILYCCRCFSFKLYIVGMIMILRSMWTHANNRYCIDSWILMNTESSPSLISRDKFCNEKLQEMTFGTWMSTITYRGKLLITCLLIGSGKCAHIIIVYCRLYWKRN
jgi:hypothetical protein